MHRQFAGILTDCKNAQFQVTRHLVLDDRFYVPARYSRVSIKHSPQLLEALRGHDRVELRLVCSPPLLSCLVQTLATQHTMSVKQQQISITTFWQTTFLYHSKYGIRKQEEIPPEITGRIDDNTILHIFQLYSCRFYSKCQSYTQQLMSFLLVFLFQILPTKLQFAITNAYIDQKQSTLCTNRQY